MADNSDNITVFSARTDARNSVGGAPKRYRFSKIAPIKPDNNWVHHEYENR